VGADYAWPGNVRELEQAVRRVLLKGAYEGDTQDRLTSSGRSGELVKAMERGEVDARALLSRYCRNLYAVHRQYGAVARITGLDVRTVRKHILSGA